MSTYLTNYKITIKNQICLKEENVDRVKQFVNSATFALCLKRFAFIVHIDIFCEVVSQEFPPTHTYIYIYIYIKNPIEYAQCLHISIWHIEFEFCLMAYQLLWVI